MDALRIASRVGNQRNPPVTRVCGWLWLGGGKNPDIEHQHTRLTLKHVASLGTHKVSSQMLSQFHSCRDRSSTHKSEGRMDVRLISMESPRKTVVSCCPILWGGVLSPYLPEVSIATFSIQYVFPMLRVPEKAIEKPKPQLQRMFKVTCSKEIPFPQVAYHPAHGYSGVPMCNPCM